MSDLVTDIEAVLSRNLATVREMHADGIADLRAELRERDLETESRERECAALRDETMKLRARVAELEHALELLAETAPAGRAA